MNCIIVEDEPLALERISDFVNKVPFLNLAASFDNGFQAIGYLQSTPVDLLFLDIQMDGLTGIQLLESLNKRPEVIITTAFDQYAIKGFDLNVCDYLLKPFTFERFMQAVAKVNEKLLAVNEVAAAKRFIFVKTEYRLEKVNLDEVLFIEGMRDYRRIHMTDRKVMTLQTFNTLQEELPPSRFSRVHKSYIVALDKIDSIERDRIKIRDEMIPISETFKAQFYKLIR